MRVVITAIVLLFTVAAAAEVLLPTAPTWTSDETDLNGTGLDIGDVNGDGWLDLAVSNGNDITESPNLVYLSQDGSLPTAASWVSTDERYSGHCQLADVDGDGYPELMVANYISPGWGTAQVQLYDNVGGNLATSPTWESPATFHSFRAVFGDPDGDGDLDLAVATGEAYHGYTEANLVFFNHGGVLEATPSWISDLDDTCYDAKFIDVDGDGDQDLAFLGGGTDGRITIYYNDGGVLATTPDWISDSGDNGNTFDFDDLDGDGSLDLAVGFNSQLGGSGCFAVFLTAGGVLPTTPSWSSAFSGYSSAIVCADLDNANGPDLVTGGWWEPVRVYLNDGVGGFPAEPDWVTDPVWESVVENIALADLDARAVTTHTAVFPTGTTLCELPDRHLQSIDEVAVDGTTFGPAVFGASLRDGWVSLNAAVAALGEISVTYAVSTALDLAISNWDDATYVFENPYPTASPRAIAPVAIANLQAWPNPFNPHTTIAFDLAADAAHASLTVYNVRGRVVDQLMNAALAAGPHEIAWRPRGLASGLYVYRLDADGAVATGKVILAR